MSLPTIFSACRPRADVAAGSIRDDGFMADLSRVVNLDPTQHVVFATNPAVGRDGKAVDFYKDENERAATFARPASGNPR